MTPAIELASISKQYVLLEERGALLRSLLPFGGARRTPFQALHDIDLRVEAGETVGILGRNGAGKTTLLRIIAGVSRPSRGTVRVTGRIAPLLSVGVGFHQELSGRENVYVNGMLLGLTRREVDERFDSIVDFAELPHAIDVPVKFYSSGMFMRLGFAVAIHVDPEILLVDEVLAVGDLAFQLKSFDRMRALKDAGTTIVIVSHSMHAVRLLCPRALLLSHGVVVLDGPVEDAIARHHELLSGDGEGPGAAAAGAHFTERVLEGPDGPRSAVVRNEPARLRFRLTFDARALAPSLELSVLSEDRTLVYRTTGKLGGPYEPGTEIVGAINFVPRVAGGSLRLVVSIRDADGRVLHDDVNGTLVYLAPVLGTSGVADLDATITLDGEVLTDHPEVTL